MKPLPLAKSRLCLWASLLGLVCGVLALSPTGQYLEEEWGLKLLFRLRGARQPPAELVLVNLDRATARQFGLPEEPEKWPRSFHARLLRALSEAGAALIAFDVVLDEARDEAGDAALADAIRQSRRVLLASDLKRETLAMGGEGGQTGGSITLDSLVQPQTCFLDEALGSAPFPIPKPLSLAKQFWMYSNDDPHDLTFPGWVLSARVLQQAYEPLRSAWVQVLPGAAERLPETSLPRLNHLNLQEFIALSADELSAHPQLTEQLRTALLAQPITVEQNRTLEAWLRAWQLGDQAHFNHYGPASALPVLSARQLLKDAAQARQLIAGKTVFVGFAEDLQPERNHGFYTFFSESSEDALSSVALVTTAYANLLDQSALQPLPMFAHALIPLAWSAWVLILAGLPRVRWVGLALLCLGAAYFALSFQQFGQAHRWVPTVIPLGVETPLMFLLIGGLRYFQTQKDRQKIFHAFGFYVPQSVVERILTSQSGPDGGQAFLVDDGVCMSTDAGQFTQLAETLNPMPLGALMNRYYASIFPQVQEAGGFVSDVVGDAMLALWADASQGAGNYRQACRCALRIVTAVERFNREEEVQLPIRIGIHAGAFRLGNVGSQLHYEYRALGDTVNTASRIENLNKRLGTRILLSGQVLGEYREFLTRELGEFLLEGKTVSLVIHELLGLRDESPRARTQERLSKQFAAALACFRLGDLEQARMRFDELQNAYPEDGPAIFYAYLCGEMMELAPEERNTQVIRLEKY